MKIDLSKNLIEDLNKDPFEQFCVKNAIIELGGNHFKCEVGTINWIKNLKGCREYLKYPTCLSSGKNVFDQIDQTQITETTTEIPSTLTTFSTFATKIFTDPSTISTTPTSIAPPSLVVYPILTDIKIPMSQIGTDSKLSRLFTR